ncbi:MAG: hypothetical protein QM704_08535 [Anaeromyxobacteraceae bacterium]
MRSTTSLLALAGLLAAGCTVSGSGKAAKPGWKVYVDEHPVSAAPFTFRSGDVEVRVHQVLVEEHHTAFGKSSWLNVVKASAVNRGTTPLPWTALTDGFRIRTRSGTETRGYAIPSGNAGWSRAQPGQPHLPPGAEGELRVQAEPGSTSVRDDPAAVAFRGQMVELR